ncbi:MAG: hypothetical protein WCP16_17620 [Pseudanabaena sp. ELA645]|jgi:hypothetical protein
MSKISNPSQSDDSNNPSLSRSVTTKPPIKDLPKLEVVKVIAPKPPDAVQNLDSKAAEVPKSEVMVKPVISVPKVIPAAARSKPLVNSRPIESSSSFSHQPYSSYRVDDRIVNNAEQEPKVSLQPIPEATEPFQYRAIGVISGRYIAREDNFAKGHILTSDGTEVDAVLLGKIISIVKKRLESDREYLWVVYPRTNDKAGKLHVQISGVWAPVELGKSDVPIDPHVQDGYFSVRGEVSSQSTEDNSVIVKVRRTEQKFDKDKDKVSKEYSKFKVRLTGLLPTDAVGQFWSVNVQRQGDVLTIIDGQFIGIIPHKGKRSQSNSRGGGGRFAPRAYGDRSYGDRNYGDRPFKPSWSQNRGDASGSIYPPRPRTAEDRPPVPRPLIKRKDPEPTE